MFASLSSNMNKLVKAVPLKSDSYQVHGVDVKDEQIPEYPGKELEAMSFAINYHQWIVDELAPFFGRTMVEVGAGKGDLSAMLIRKGLKQLYAFEPSLNLFPSLRAKAEGLSQVTAINEFFKPDFVPEAFDSLLYINVLEHIEDDCAELFSAYRALPIGGYLLLFVPALSWLFSNVDRSAGHFRRYYKKALVKMVEQTGFRVERVRYFDLAGIIPWYVNFVLLRNTFSAGSVALYDRLIVPPMRVFEKKITPPIGKNILLVARKV
jgi:SAM-dependent methyltransferase